VAPLTNNIQRYTLSSATDTVAVGTGAASRILLRASEDVRLALDEQYLTTDNYFTIAAGSTLVLDPPNFTSGYFLWFRLDSATTGTLEVWLQGVKA